MYKEIDFVKRNILSLYEDDLKKYNEENREKASVIYKTIPEQLENHNSHFKFSLVDKNARYKNYVDAVNFFSESMIGNECINVTAPEVSLEAYADRCKFKLYMGDTGLLVSQMMKNNRETGTDLYKALIFDKLGINQGMIVENKKICPIEVKSSGYKTHKSFDCLIEKYQLKVQDRYIIYTKDLKFEDGITYIPLYMTCCIQ